MRNLSFDEYLRLESDRILQDPIFRRSPIQSQLLRYLVKRAAEGGPAPSQYEIAVDGLGRDADFDLSNDSYPRVQISRLRSNLDAYYSRNLPVADRRIVIELGEYHLKLEPRNEPHISNGPVATTEMDDVPTPSQDDPSGMMRKPAPQMVNEPSLGVRMGPTRWLALVGILAVIALLASVAAAWFTWASTQVSFDGKIDEPSVKFERGSVDLSALPVDLRGDANAAIMRADVQLAFSLVSRLHSQTSLDEPNYELQVYLDALDLDTLEAVILLYDNRGERIFTDRVLLEAGSGEAFKREFEAALVYVTSPNGAIARSIDASIGPEPKSAYACFVRIETSRARGTAVGDLIENCIKAYPNERYSAYLYARRAFNVYQNKRAAGEPVERTGMPWRDVQKALELNQFNAFANFVAAKVELANNRCDVALTHIDQAFQNAPSYPALLAALDAEANSCSTYVDKDMLPGGDLRDMVERNPAPDALLHVYLLIAALSSGDQESAAILAARPRTGSLDSNERQAVELLHRAMIDPQFARANEELLRSSMKQFIWNDNGIDRVLAGLSAQN